MCIWYQLRMVSTSLHGIMECSLIVDIIIKTGCVHIWDEYCAHCRVGPPRSLHASPFPNKHITSSSSVPPPPPSFPSLSSLLRDSHPDKVHAPADYLNDMEQHSTGTTSSWWAHSNSCTSQLLMHFLPPISSLSSTANLSSNLLTTLWQSFPDEDYQRVFEMLNEIVFHHWWCSKQYFSRAITIIIVVLLTHVYCCHLLL